MGGGESIMAPPGHPSASPPLPPPLLSAVSGDSPWLSLLALGVSAALFVVGVGGNVAVLLLLCGVGGPPRGLGAALLGALCAALGLLAAAALPAAVAAETSLVGHAERRQIHVALRYCEALVLGVCTFTLCALAMERLRAAFLPTHSGADETWASIAGKIAIIWAGAALLALPELLPPLITLGRSPSEPPLRLVPSPSADVSGQTAGVPSVPMSLAADLALGISSAAAAFAPRLDRSRREATFGASPTPELRRRSTGNAGEARPGWTSHGGDSRRRRAAAGILAERLHAAYERSRVWWIFGCHFCLPLVFSASCSALAACRARCPGKGRPWVCTRRRAQAEGQLHTLLLSLAIVHGVCVSPRVFMDVATAPGRVPGTAATGWLVAMGHGLAFCEASAVPAVVLLLRWRETQGVRAAVRGCLVSRGTPVPATPPKEGQTRINFRMMRADSIQSTSV
ncbi:G-protein coupled receptor 37-like 1 [Lethenteron reissneri]|uniref:G-protein coupled receptor 37-like 1 n=1 Tax=Lethenteron reissneri TaxID=7753 RepID=UPI002AB66B1E|nr:G-protein coupled receptor 37-like 1 [Lethenteron reissneri]